LTTRHSGIGMTSQRTRTRMIERLREQGITDEVVLAAMNAVPRHIFVDEALASRAYDDVALPIGFGQTISSPYIVAQMSSLLRVGKNLEKNIGKVLEIGTGCGYQSAVLAQLASEVYSVERIAPLLERTRARLRELRLGNIRLKLADGTAGLAEAAPFDAIIMTAATAHVQQALLDQLAVGGRMIYPKGTQEQWLCVIARNTEGFVETQLEEVRFVPLLNGIQRSEDR